jgi:hypothetical protein
MRDTVVMCIGKGTLGGIIGTFYVQNSFTNKGLVSAEDAEAG